MAMTPEYKAKRNTRIANLVLYHTNQILKQCLDNDAKLKECSINNNFNDFESIFLELIEMLEACIDTDALDYFWEDLLKLDFPLYVQEVIQEQYDYYKTENS